MLREEQVLIRRLIEQTKKNQIRWRLPASAFGGYEFSSNAGCFVVEWLQDDKPTLSVRSGGETFLIRDYSIGALIGLIRKQVGLPPTKKIVPGRTKLEKVMIQEKRKILQLVLKFL